jgi:diphthamide biosynthesis protein 7
MSPQHPTSKTTTYLDQPPSCLQFCPASPNNFLIGTYLLSSETKPTQTPDATEEDESSDNEQTETIHQTKTGSLQLWNLNPETDALYLTTILSLHSPIMHMFGSLYTNREPEHNSQHSHFHMQSSTCTSTRGFPTFWESQRARGPSLCSQSVSLTLTRTGRRRGSPTWLLTACTRTHPSQRCFWIGYPRDGFLNLGLDLKGMGSR